MTVEFLDDEAIADIAYKVKTDNLIDLFRESLHALFNLLTNTDKLTNEIHHKFSFQSKDLERLLHEVLDEVIYLKDAEYFVAKDLDVKINEKDNIFTVFGEFIGTEFDFDKHERGNDVKAITWHDFSLRKIDNYWEAYILVDI